MQALLVPYTEFRRADGHVIWAHRDEWEGQHFNWAPGTLLSDAERVRLDPRERILGPVAVSSRSFRRSRFRLTTRGFGG